MKKICYLSGTRADFGLMRNLLKKLDADPAIDLSICVTAMHLSPKYGMTVNEIKAQGFRISGQIEVDVDSSKPETMAKCIGHEIIGITDVLMQEKPELLILLGDRGESLAAAIAAVHLNIHIVHIHGGERSGTVDEMVRHAISKLSHYHFVATPGASERLIKMGEMQERVHIVGAPGLDDIKVHLPCSKEVFCERFSLDSSRPVVLLIYHPVVQEYAGMAEQMHSILEALISQNLQIICLEPNADAGGEELRLALNEYRHYEALRIVKHLLRSEYLDCLANADIVLGNSSSGIIEAASFNRLVLNVGSRQNLRERSTNTIDVGYSKEEILTGLRLAMNKEASFFTNVYGDGESSERCYQLIKSISCDFRILNKFNAY